MASNRSSNSSTLSNPNYNQRSKPQFAPIPLLPYLYYQQPMNKKDLNQVISTAHPIDSLDDLDHEEMAQNQNLTLKEMAAPELEQQPLCIKYP